MFDDLVKNLKENGLATVVVVMAMTRFGYVGAGPNTPAWAKPKPATPPASGS